ncbi:unnamed protein product [Vicia faba]|uniref:Riboflavin biosynthesis protein PYRD, chloroplastic n=1 Tax=Vicia faba TaxID=3906 RepID=A0AAV0YPF9_VICFA|nr:unnamed protein product [Vicia faba]
MQAMGLSVAVSVPFYHSRLCINASPHPPIPLNLNHGFSKSLTFRDRLTRGKSSYVIRSQKNRDDDGDVDGFYMRKSVELARKALGCTSPNPLVGCVIVKDGQIVGQGFHPKPGQPHAEVFALRDAADLDENATAYVTLEPCNHFGRTPPCTEVLIKARLKKVVVGMVDPNPIVASKGLDRLRGAGIEVVVGVEEELCKGLNEGYMLACDHPLLVKEYNSDPVGKDSVEMAKRLPKEMLINLFNSLETTAAICFVCNRPENKLGDDETWDRAESALKEALDECGKGNVFVKNLAKSIDNVGLHDLFQEYGNILSSKIVISEDGKSKGFGYIQFGSEESANDAIQKMNGSTVRDKQIYVGKFIRKSERSLPEPDAKYTNLYVKNLDPDITEALLKEKFSSFGKILSLAIVKDEKGLSKGFGFMNYENPDDARRATEAMNGSQFGSKNLYVARAQKKVEREKILHQWFAERCMEKNLKYKGSNIYVKNIDDSVSDEELKSQFVQINKENRKQLPYQITGMVKPSKLLTCFQWGALMVAGLCRGKMLGKAYCSSSIHTGVIYHHPKGSTTFYHHSSGSIGLESPADGRRSSESSYRIGDNGTSGGTN